MGLDGKLAVTFGSRFSLIKGDSWEEIPFFFLCVTLLHLLLMLGMDAANLKPRTETLTPTSNFLNTFVG